MPITHIVCLVTEEGQRRRSTRYVGPFDDENTARSYVARIEQSSNGSVKAHVATMIEP